MSLPQIPFRMTLVAAALTAALSAHAQQAAAPATSAQPAKADDARMQKVEVRGSADAYNPRRDDTASKIVVNHDEIVKYGDTNVVDVLKRLPGVTVSGASGRGGGEVRMRGLGSGYTQILLNGERAPAGFSLDSLAPDMIERIEVLRAASAEFSTQSIAGTINIILKKAISKAQRELKVGIGGSHEFVHPNVNLQLSDRAGQFSYSLSVNVMHQQFGRESPTVEEGFDPAGRQVLLRDSATSDDGRFNSLNISPRLNWTFANGDTITSQSFVNLNRFRRDATTTVRTAVGSPPPYPLVDSSMTNDNDFYRSDLNWVHKMAGGAKLDLKVGAMVGQLANDLYRLGDDPAGRTVLDSVVLSEGTDYIYTSTGKYSTPIVEGHALAVGWDGGFSTRDDARVQREQPLPGAFPVNSDEVYDARIKRLAVYAQDEWNVTRNWSVYVGARWEGIQTRTRGNTFATSDSSSSVFSPLFQTLYKLPNTKGDQVRFAVTRTYKAPGLQSLIPRRFTSVNNSSTEPDFMGNPDLKPELALGFDAAYEHYWAEGALLSASASMRKIEGYTRNGIIFDGERWVSRPVNDGNAQTRGIELEAKFPLKTLVPNAPALDLRASVSRNWSTVEAVQGPYNRLAGQTPFSATVGVDYKGGKLSTGGSFAFKNGGPVRLSTTQTSYVSVRRDLEAYALWKFNPKHQLRVVVANILQQDYFSESSYADSSGSVHRRSRFPGHAVVRATMEMKF